MLHRYLALPADRHMQYQHACVLGPITHREVVATVHPGITDCTQTTAGRVPFYILMNHHVTLRHWFMALLYDIALQHPHLGPCLPSLLAADQASCCTFWVQLEVVVTRAPSFFFAPVLWSYRNTMLAIAYCYPSSAPSMESASLSSSFAL